MNKIRRKESLVLIEQEEKKKNTPCLRSSLTEIKFNMLHSAQSSITFTFKEYKDSN